MSAAHPQPLRLEPIGAHAQFEAVRFRVERFHYTPADLLLRLSLRLSLELPPSARPTLMIEHDEVHGAYSPIVSSTGRGPLRDASRLNDAGDWLWRAAFAVAPDVVGDPQAGFALRLRDELVLELPIPSGVGIAGSGEMGSFDPARGAGGARPWPRLVRRSALLIVVSVQLALAPGWGAVGALADAGTEVTAEVPVGVTGETTVPSAPAPEEVAPPATEETSPKPPLKGFKPPAHPPTESPSPASQPAAEAPAPGSSQSGAGAQSAPAPGVTGETAAPSPHSAASAPGQGAVRLRTTRAPGAAGAPSVADSFFQQGSASQRRSHARANARHHQAHKSPASMLPVPGSPLGPIGGLLEPTSLLSGLGLGAFGATEEGPPLYLVPLYRAAGRRYHVPWTVLAAINSVETDYGRNLAVSSAGAVGWMQFMPATWSTYGLDADRDGFSNPYSPKDAIFSAARYLKDSGGAHDLAGAIFAYNHAGWYVSEVIERARLLRSLEAPATIARIAKLHRHALGLLAASAEIATPYVWGGETAHTAFDCSGLVQWAFARVGVKLPRTAQEQYDATKRVEPADVRPGDLVFFGSSSAGVSHVGIVAGANLMLDATHTGAYVEFSSFTPQIGAPFGSDLLVGYGRTPTPVIHAPARARAAAHAPAHAATHAPAHVKTLA